jgi:hypothetical protein
VNFAALHFQVDALERLHAGVGLTDIFQFQKTVHAANLIHRLIHTNDCARPDAPDAGAFTN